MRAITLVPAVLLSACASATASSPPPVLDQTISIPTAGVATTMTNLRITSSSSATQRIVPARVDRVWGALAGVYDLLALPVSSSDAASRVVSASSIKLRRRLGNVPLSRYIDCGSTQGAPSADSYEVLLTLETRVQAAAGDSAAVSTTLDAMARPVFVSSEYVHCGSTGALERRLFETLAAQLHTPSGP